MIIREAIDFKRGQGVKASLGVGMIYQIEEWLSKLNDEGDIGEWTINEDHSISVIGRVDLRGNIDGNLPEYINFNKILKNNETDKSGNKIEPYYYFSAVGVNLTSLRGMPNYLAGDYAISGNNLGDLDGCPRHIGGNLYMENTELHSLEGAPDYVGGSVFVGGNPGLFMDIDVRRAIETIRGGIHLLVKK